MINKTQLGNVDYFSYFGSLIRNYARCIREIKSRIAMAKATLKIKKIFSRTKFGFKLRMKVVKCYIESLVLYGAGPWALRKVDQKYLESFGGAEE